jgi:hypothetical protein
MLRKEAVSPQLLKLLQRLMSLPELNKHHLVRGTALALQIGHRISVDIDLFSPTETNYKEIEAAISREFKGEFKVAQYINSTFGKGICFYLEGIKTDMIDWKMSLKCPIIEMEKIRMASKEDILGMKLDIITAAPEYARYDKKDFVDLACLLNDFSISQMIEIYRQRHPQIAYPERIVLEGFQYAELADKKPHPNMLIDLSWEDVKSKIARTIQEYLYMRKIEP